MSFEITGRLIVKQDTVQVSDRFKKREFVLERIDSFGSSEIIDNIKFQLTQDRCDLLDNIQLNDEIKLTFNLRGRKWEKDGQVSYFNSLDVWKIEKSSIQREPAPPPPTMADIPPEPTDDLPF